MFRRPLSPTRLVRAAVLGAALLSTSTAAEARRAALRADVEGYAMAACLTRQDVPYLREQGHLWGNAILQRGHGSVEDWTTLADAVGAAAARQTMSMARGDGAVHDALKRCRCCSVTNSSAAQRSAPPRFGRCGTWHRITDRPTVPTDDPQASGRQKRSVKAWIMVVRPPRERPMARLCSPFCPSGAALGLRRRSRIAPGKWSARSV